MYRRNSEDNNEPYMYMYVWKYKEKFKNATSWSISKWVTPPPSLSLIYFVSSRSWIDPYFVDGFSFSDSVVRFSHQYIIHKSFLRMVH